MTTKIPHIIHVDLQSHAKRQIVYMKQGDEMSRELLIFFYNGGSAWAVPSEITSVSLSYCKADKVHGCYDHIADEVAYVFGTGRTSVTMAIHPQVLTAAGNIICELKLCNASGHALNTFNFVINCEQSPHAMGQQSEGYWNNVFDGATFTPHVSSDGILSWTNDKNLPNPEPVDIALYGFVVPQDGVPVQTMEIVTSADAEENVTTDKKLLTPAAAQVLIDRVCPPSIEVTFPSGFKSTSRLFSTAKNYAKNDQVYRLANGSGEDGLYHFYKTNAGGHTAGAWDASHFTDLGTLTIPAGLNILDYSEAIARGTLHCVYKAGADIHARVSAVSSGSVNVSALNNYTNMLVTFNYDTSTGAITMVKYSAFGYEFEV